MKKSKFTEAQIVFAIKQFETGTRVDDISRLMVISQATFFNWKKQYGRWVVYQNSEIRHERQTQKIYQQLLRRPQMKPEEKIAERFLSEQSLGRIIYEPKGQRTPDFSINDEIGVEVRRLNKHLKATPLEKLQFDITPVQNNFLTALAKIGPMSYLPFTTTKPKAYVKNNSTCPNDSTVASRKVQKIGK